MRFSHSLPPFLLLVFLLGLQPSAGHRTPLHSVGKMKAEMQNPVVVDVGDIINDDPMTPEPTTTPTPEPTTTPAAEIVPRVTVSDLGTVIGTTLTSFKGNEFYAFMSIPYAKSPERDLRFDYPKPYEGRWPKETEDGEYEATFLRARCVQASLFLPIVAGREDCLHLSIYTPVFPEPDMKNHIPVMVWFHGGAYMSGDANLYVPTKLMDREVMVVVVQYRLASFGFLPGNMEGNPGNMGLMDQIQSLRWIQDYIKDFGGNPDKVTVFGQSAGGASTSWMQLTPLTNKTAEKNKDRDLLHQVIPQSGSALEIWTIDPNPNEGFLQTASLLGCNYTEDKTEMLKCMRDKDYTEVFNASSTIYYEDRLIGGLGFKGLCPIVQDGKALGDTELVIPKSPQEIIDNLEFMKVPMMAGAVRDEGSLVVGIAYRDYMAPLGHYTNDTDFVKYEAVSALISAFGLSDQNNAVASSMRVAYFPDAELGNWTSMIGGMVDMTGVMFLKSGLWNLVSSINRVAPEIPIYFYSFEFESEDSLFPWMFFSDRDIPVPGGVSHADELLYLFHLPAYIDGKQLNMTEKILNLWTNFAIYGDPTPNATNNWKDLTPKWETYDNDNYGFMLMQDDFVMSQDFTKRWTYHSKNKLSEDIPQKDSAQESSWFQSPSWLLSEGEPVVAKEGTPEEPTHGKNYKIFLGVFEGFVVLAVVSGCIYAIFYRQKTRRNGIV